MSKKPVKLVPCTKEYIWGGTKLKTYFNKQADTATIAESWEFSAIDGSESKIFDNDLPEKNLVELLRNKPEWFGECASRDMFPVLIKIIDATKDLSVQVHPSDEYALLHEASLGKTEMWYVVDAEKDGAIYLGFERDVSKQIVKEAIASNTLVDLLHKIEVKQGDFFFVPSGTVHALLHGVTVVEVQQSSSLTYRLYDYARRDAQGNLRELHVEKALDVLNYGKFKDVSCTQQLNETEKFLCSTPYFTSYQVQCKSSYQISNDKSFVAITVFDGKGSFADGTPICKGDTWFIPCGLSVQIDGNLSFIATTV